MPAKKIIRRVLLALLFTLPLLALCAVLYGLYAGAARPLLYEAVKGNNPQEIVRLLEAGEYINENPDAVLKGTPLILAVTIGAYEAAETLVQQGADVNAKDTFGNADLLLSMRLRFPQTFLPVPTSSFPRRWEARGNLYVETLIYRDFPHLRFPRRREARGNLYVETLIYRDFPHLRFPRKRESIRPNRALQRALACTRTVGFPLSRKTQFHGKGLIRISTSES